jgi:hypothetical protein
VIAAGLLLLAVGAADLVRQFVIARRWIPYTIGAVLLLGLSAGVDALVAGALAVAVAAIWVVVMPVRGSGRAGLWPVALLALAAAGCVLLTGPRQHPGFIGDIWPASGPVGAVSIDVVVLVSGCVVFLLESANAVVRVALRSEAADGVAAVPADGSDAVVPAATMLKGGRLIGPLERILVFALTLAGAYTLLAAVLAAKGIVRFPEISRDGDTGNRAEYFLVGSLVSWVTALAAAFLVWWGVSAP